jgi:hypothetical protein
MAVSNPPADFVIRLGNVTIDQNGIERALEAPIDRYSRSRDGATNYAQLSLSNGACEWQEVVRFLEVIGPRIKRLIEQGAVGFACIDFAVYPPEGTQAKFFTLPASVSERAGRNLIDVEVSIYAAGQEEEQVRS